MQVSLSRACALAWADGGLLGLFRGNSATILKAVPGTATKFAAYDHIRDSVIASRAFGPADPANPRGSWAVHVTAGGLAGLLEGTVTHPLETVRTIMQMPDSKAKTFLQARCPSARVSHTLCLHGARMLPTACPCVNLCVRRVSILTRSLPAAQRRDRVAARACACVPSAAAC